MGKVWMRHDIWDELYRQYYPQLRRYFASHVPSDDAADLAQEVFVELAGREVPNEPNSYLRAMARNMLFRYLRGQNQELAALERLLADTARGANSGLDELGPGPTEGTSKTELDDILNEAATKLPPKHLQLLKMRLVENRSVREIAGKMACSEQAVRKRLQRSKRMLRESKRD